jgi:hypothetical protein
MDRFRLQTSLAGGRYVTRHAIEKPHLSGVFVERMMGLEPTTFCMASRRSSQLSYIRTRRGL